MKIINNKKLVSVIIILLLFGNFIFSNTVFAAVTWRGNSATGSIQEVLDSMRTSGNATTQTIKDKVPITENSFNKLKEAVISKLKEKFSSLEDDMYEKTYNYYRNDQEMIEVTCNIGGSGSTTGYYISSFTVNLGSGLTLAKIEENVAGKTDEEIGEPDTDAGYLPPASGATGQDPDPDGDTIVETEDTSEPSEPSDGSGAGTGGGSTGPVGGGTSGMGTELPSLDLFKPTLTVGEVSRTVVMIGKILGILRILGAIMTVVSIAIIGFGAMLGSASEKAEYQQKLTGVIIAGIFLVASTSIAKMIMDVAVNM